MTTAYFEQALAEADARVAQAKRDRRALPLPERIKEHALDWYVALCAVVRAPNLKRHATRQILNDWAWAVIRWRHA